MSLVTGEIVTRAPGYWTELVISDPAIARVEVMAKDQGQPTLQDSNLLVEWSPDQQIDNDEYNKDYEPSEADEMADEEYLDEEFYQQFSDNEGEQASDDFPTPSSNQSQSTQGEPQEGPTPSNHEETPTQLTQPTSDGDAGAQPSSDTTDGSEDMTPEGEDGYVSEAEVNDATIPHDESSLAPEPEPEPAPNTQAAEDTNNQLHPYNLRGNRSRSYHHRLAHSMDNPTSEKSYEPPTTTATQLFQVGDQKEECERAETGDRKKETDDVRRVLHGWVMMQMSARAGIRRFGDAAKEAMKKEFRQLDEKGVFEPVLSKDLSPETKTQALCCINVIKQK